MSWFAHQGRWRWYRRWMENKVLGWFIVATFFVGCGKGENSYPVDSGTANDGGNDGGNGGGNDGGSDGGSDGGIDGDLSGDATIVTESALFGGTIGAKVGGIDIISHLPDDTVLATTRTDASGNAVIKVYPGGSVTAVYRHTIDMGADLITWVGVKPGDTLTFGSQNFSTIGQQSVNLGAQTYSWPALAGATSFRVYTSCAPFGMLPGGTSTSLVGSEFSTCHQEPMDVVYAAFSSNSTLLGLGVRSNVAFASGATVALGSWLPAKTGSIDITGLPAEISSVIGTFRPVFDAKTEATIFTPNYNGTPTGGAFSAPFNWYPTGDRTVGSLFLVRTGFRNMQVLDSFSVDTLTQTVAAPVLPAWLQGNMTVSPALRMASWFLVSDPSSDYDGQVLRAEWSRVISSMSHDSQWDFILPPGQTSITFPTLPSQFSDIQPLPDDLLFASNRVFDIPSVTGYDMLRTLPSAKLMCLECSVRTGDFQRIVFTQL
jgi:hypothetical protein